MIKLSKVVMRDGAEVPFDSTVDKTLISSKGDLELDLDARLIHAKPGRVGRDPIVIPLEQVRYYVIGGATDNVAKTPPAEVAQFVKPAPKQDPNKDKVKFVKQNGLDGMIGPDGKFVPLDIRK